MKYRNDIDGLRAVAILPVVFYHANVKGFEGGFIGVDVFFVISGYLITSLLLEEIRTTGSVNLASFYARRARRLLPALLLVVLVALALGAITLTPVGGEQKALGRSAIAALLFHSNFYFANKTGGYFDAPSESLPLLHTWSLGVEEQFYFIWPLIMVACIRVAGGRNFSKYFIFSLGILFAVSLIYSYLATLGDSQTAHFAFFMLTARAWELVIGALLAYALPHLSAPKPALGAALSALGVGAILFAATHFRAGMPYPGIAAIVPTVGTSAVIVGCTMAPDGLVRRLLSSRILVGIGLVSYSWYLWHWPLLVYGRMAATAETASVVGLLLIALSFAFAVLTYLYVEQPIRTHRFTASFSELKILSAAAMAIIVAVGSAQGLVEYSKYLKEHGPGYDYLTLAQKDVGWSRHRCLHDGDEDFVALKPIKSCIERPEGARHYIMLWGDSHADHYAGMLENVTKSHNLGILPRTMSGCPPLLNVHIRTNGKDRKNCDQFNREVFKEIQAGVASGEITAIVISARWTQYVGKPSIAGNPFYHELLDGDSPASDQPALLALGLSSTLKALSKLGVKILIIKPIPEQLHNVPNCLAWKTAEQCSVKLDRAEAHRSLAQNAIKTAISNVSGTQLWDPFGPMCDDEICLVKRDGIVMYRDDDHLSYSGAVWLSSKFMSTFADWLAIDPTLHLSN